MRTRDEAGPALHVMSRGSVVLLTLLLGHLILMFSPFHEVMRTEAAAHLTVAHGAPHALLAGGETASPDAHDARGGDCAIKWATVSQGFNSASLLAVAIVGGTGEIDLQRSTTLMPHAIRPPIGGDAQALLQVFRL